VESNGNPNQTAATLGRYPAMRLEPHRTQPGSWIWETYLGGQLLQRGTSPTWYHASVAAAESLQEFCPNLLLEPE